MGVRPQLRCSAHYSVGCTVYLLVNRFFPSTETMLSEIPQPVLSAMPEQSLGESEMDVEEKGVEDVVRVTTVA